MVLGTLLLCCRPVIEHVSARWVVWCMDRPETVFVSAFLLLLCNFELNIMLKEPFLYIIIDQFFLKDTFLKSLIELFT